MVGSIMKGWIKGGIIGAGMDIVIVLIFEILLTRSTLIYPEVWSRNFCLTQFVIPCTLIGNKYLVYLFGIILLFILGSLIGIIIQKVKK